MSLPGAQASSVQLFRAFAFSIVGGVLGCGGSGSSPTTPTTPTTSTPTPAPVQLAVFSDPTSSFTTSERRAPRVLHRDDVYHHLRHRGGRQPARHLADERAGAWRLSGNPNRTICAVELFRRGSGVVVEACGLGEGLAMRGTPRPSCVTPQSLDRLPRERQSGLAPTRFIQKTFLITRESSEMMCIANISRV